MTNQYKFHCPVSQGEEMLTDCERKHGEMMKGNADRVEPQICSVAHQCFMCPIRSAFRVGGPWSKPGSKPIWSEPKSATKLPKEILQHAIYHTLPSEQMYRRAGDWSGSMPYNDHLASLQTGGTVEAPRFHESVDKKAPKKRKKPATSAGAIESIETDEMATAVSAAVKATEGAQEALKPKRASTAQKKTQPAPEGAASGSVKKLTLAERAKLMREKKAATQAAT